MKGLLLEVEKLLLHRMSLSDRTQAKSHVPRRQMLTDCYSLQLNTRAAARGGPGVQDWSYTPVESDKCIIFLEIVKSCVL